MCSLVYVDPKRPQECQGVEIGRIIFLSVVSIKRFLQFYKFYKQFLMILYSVLQFSQRAIEKPSTFHTWPECRMLPTPCNKPDIENVNV